jgi:prolipoprotein diacylglyceryltransferase
MRPRYVAALNGFFNTTAFDRLVPGVASLFGAAMLVTVIVFVRRSNWRGLDRYHAAGMGLWAMLGGLVGARAFYLVQHAQAILADTS